MNMGSSDLATVSESILPFKPGKVLIIEAVGIRAFRLPLPSFELEIKVLDLEGNLIYTSTRQKVCSGDSILSSPKSGEIATQVIFSAIDGTLLSDYYRHRKSSPR